MTILFLTHRLPYTPNRGDRIRAYHLLREMSRWAEVDVCALAHDADEASHADDLRAIARSVTVARVPRLRNLARALTALPSSAPLTHVLLQSPALGQAVDRLSVASRPDLVFCFCTGVAPYALRTSLAGIPVVLDMVDVDSSKWALLSRSAFLPMSWLYRREAVRLSEFEGTLTSRVAWTTVVTEAEKIELLRIAPRARVAVIGNGVDIEHFRPPASPRRPTYPTVVFCGVMDYFPNVEGARWLATAVWPLVRNQLPDARLQIVGSRPTASVRHLADPTQGIEVTGEVPDVRPYLWHASVAVAPLLTARGVQNKVLEAAAAGLRVVVTPAVSRGVPPAIFDSCIIAATPEAFANAVVANATSQPSAPTTPPDLSWHRQLGNLRPLLEDAAAGL